jgi:hypothetical protein
MANFKRQSECYAKLFSIWDIWPSFSTFYTLYPFSTVTKSKLKEFYSTLNYNSTIINTLSSHHHQDTDHAIMHMSKQHKILIYLQKAHVTKLYNKVQLHWYWSVQEQTTCKYDSKLLLRSDSMYKLRCSVFRCKM